MAFDPRQFGGVTPYPQLGGGVLAALALAGQQFAQGLLERQKIEREQQQFDLQKRLGEQQLELGGLQAARERRKSQTVADYFKDNPTALAAIPKGFHGVTLEDFERNAAISPQVRMAYETALGLPKGWHDKPITEVSPPAAEAMRKLGIDPEGMTVAQAKDAGFNVSRYLATEKAPVIGKDILPELAKSPLAGQRIPVDEWGRVDPQAFMQLVQQAGIPVTDAQRILQNAEVQLVQMRVRGAQADVRVAEATEGARIEAAKLQPEQIKAQIAALLADAKRAREAAKNPGLSDKDKAILNEYTQLSTNQAALFSRLSQIDNALDLSKEQKEVSKAQVQAQIDAVQKQITALRPRYDAILGIAQPPAPSGTLPAEAVAFIEDAKRKRVPLTQVEAWAKQNGLDLEAVRKAYGTPPPQTPKPEPPKRGVGAILPALQKGVGAAKQAVKDVGAPSKRASDIARNYTRRKQTVPKGTWKSLTDAERRWLVAQGVPDPTRNP